MKKNTHPKYKPLKIKIGDDVFNTMSAAPQDEILMDIDFRKHPAWTKKGISTASFSDKNVSAFNKRFAGLSLGLKQD
ncbi:MAG: 50S ribosomal protein L31 [Rickettsiaceae bacterium]|nr:50S ribosomal protein L31 [Rickettsiaceae bacterium]